MFLGTAGYSRHALKGVGCHARAWNSDWHRGRRDLASSRRRRDRRQHLFRDDHARAVVAVYFIYLQTPFTHGEDGTGHSARVLIGIFNLANPTVLYYVILASFRSASWSFSAPSIAVRRGVEIDPGERAAGDPLGYKTDQYKLLPISSLAPWRALPAR